MTAQTIPAIERINLPGDRPNALQIVDRVLDVTTTDRTQFINITGQINEIVRESGIAKGFVHLQTLHTTAGVFISGGRGSG